MAQEKATLLYFGDPMCSWCYGFSPAFSAAVAALDNNTAEVEMIMGGLRPYHTETMPELAGFLQHHWEEVGERSGQPFRYDILQETAIVYDTEPACRAVVTARKMNPSLTLAYFKAVQKAFYFDNKNPNLTATYVEVAAQFGLEEKTFRQLFESEEMKKAVREDFSLAAEMGVRGFPTVILKKGADLYLLSNGYTEATELISKVNRILSAKN